MTCAGDPHVGKWKRSRRSTLRNPCRAQPARRGAHARSCDSMAEHRRGSTTSLAEPLGSAPPRRGHGNLTERTDAHAAHSRTGDCRERMWCNRGEPRAKACCSDAHAETQRGRAAGGREPDAMSAKVMMGAERPTSVEERKWRAPRMSGIGGRYEKVCDSQACISALVVVT